ncbi:6957_t:CDS:2 [Entrophospora sp. SA101]|nr:6957_t:CDS:2 [Entrophospora sp. SA101]
MISIIDLSGLLKYLFPINKNGSLVRNPPLFPPTLWSVHGLVEHGHPRLQNTVEAWNHQWNTLIGRAHQLENIGATLFL